MGVFAALDQVGIANQVTNPVLYTALATVGAILAIGVGGGAVRPMQERWERILTNAERETSRQISAYQRGRADAMSAPAPEIAYQQTYYGQSDYDRDTDYGQNP